MIKKIVYEPASVNTCAYCHVAQTTPEGLLCRKHWGDVPEVLKNRYQNVRVQAMRSLDECR